MSAEEMMKRAREYGVDLSMLRERLRWTPTQRLEHHQSALELVTELRRAGAKHRAQSQRSDSSPSTP